MDTVAAVMIIEGDGNESPEEIIEAWQTLIDTGVVWQLQGWYGRTAKQMIDSGLCKCSEMH